MAIKKQPQDFIVEEVLDPSWLKRLSDTPASDAPFAVYHLAKRSLSTPEAVSLLARRLGVRAADINFGGLKDKHAQTTQYVTLKVGDGMPQPPADISDEQWSARRIGFAAERVDASLIAANRFRVTVRTLTHRDLQQMGVAARRLTSSRAAGSVPRIINYFGDQRFGSARAGSGTPGSATPGGGGGGGGGFIAPLLIRGEFEEALRIAIAVPHRDDTMRVKTLKRAAQQHWGRWHDIYRATDPRPRKEGQSRVPEARVVQHLINNPRDFRGAFAKLPYLFQHMAVEAYQSLLWNRIARRMVEQRIHPERYLRAADKFGDMLFPVAGAMPPPWIEMDLPVLGEDSELREPWKGAAEHVLSEEGITTANLKIPGLERPWFGESPRRLVVEARAFQMQPPEPDEMQTAAKRFKVTLSFELPRGSYATVLLRALGS